MKHKSQITFTLMHCAVVPYRNPHFNETTKPNLETKLINNTSKALLFIVVAFPKAFSWSFACIVSGVAALAAER